MTLPAFTPAPPNRAGLTIRHLQAFAAVADTLNFTEASRRLGMTPAAVSQTIRELEHQLQFPLFNRTSRRVWITKSGEEFLPAVLRTLDQVQLTELAAKNARNRFAGIIRVAAPQAIASTLLPRCIVDYRNRHPTVHIRIIDCKTEGLGVAVESGNADIAVGPHTPASEAIREIQIHSSPMTAYFSANHRFAGTPRIDWADLVSERIVAVGKDLTTQLKTLPTEIGNALATDYVVENIVTALGIAAAGPEITIAPEFVGVFARIMGLGSRTIESPRRMCELCIYTSRIPSATPAVLEFAGYLSRELLNSAR